MQFVLLAFYSNFIFHPALALATHLWGTDHFLSLSLSGSLALSLVPLYYIISVRRVHESSPIMPIMFERSPAHNARRSENDRGIISPRKPSEHRLDCIVVSWNCILVLNLYPLYTSPPRVRYERNILGHSYRSLLIRQCAVCDGSISPKRNTRIETIKKKGTIHYHTIFRRMGSRKIMKIFLAVLRCFFFIIKYWMDLPWHL